MFESDASATHRRNKVPDRDNDLNFALPVFQQEGFALIRTFSASFGDIEPSDASIERILKPRTDSLSALASRYALPPLTEPGRFTQTKMRESLLNAGRAINRRYGQKWTDGALEFVLPNTVRNLSRKYQSKPERVIAVYLTILQMPTAYDKFTAMRPTDGRISKRDLEQARAADQRCGVFPIC